MQTTAIIILNYNNYEDTINCIESVEKYNSAPVKYIVVDNGSLREGTVERLHEFLSGKFAQSYLRLGDDCNVISQLPLMTFLVSKTNDGYARGNNKGLHLAKADEEVGQILILNNDILFIEDIIPELLQNIETLPQVGIVSPMLLKKNKIDIDYNCARTNVSNWFLILTYLFMFSDPFGLLSKANDSQYLLKNRLKKDRNDIIEMELPSGSCMLFKKELMNKIVVFDDHTFLYHEENILYKQEERIGVKNYLIPWLRCVHVGASSTKKSVRSFVVEAHIQSACYYLRNYGDMTFLQKVILPVAVFILRIKIIFLRFREKTTD